MVICVDVGNSTISIGVFKNNILFKQISHLTHPIKDEKEYVLLLKDDLKKLEIDISDIDDVIYSSVVSDINLSLTQAFKSLLNKEIIIVSSKLEYSFGFDIDDKNEVGSDLLADLEGAFKKYKSPTIIADLGTATKILVIDKKNNFSTCLIMPGIAISTSILTDKASLLPEIKNIKPTTVLAKNTIDAINSGIIIGHAEMIIGLVSRIEKTLGYSCNKILTGGSSLYVNDFLNDFKYEENLPLEGLYVIYERNL